MFVSGLEGRRAGFRELASCARLAYTQYGCYVAKAKLNNQNSLKACPSHKALGTCALCSCQAILSLEDRQIDKDATMLLGWISASGTGRDKADVLALARRRATGTGLVMPQA